VMDNLNTHTAPDVLLFALAHPRWEFVFQPIYTIPEKCLRFFPTSEYTVCVRL
jgi:hypothetical protein